MSEDSGEREVAMSVFGRQYPAMVRKATMAPGASHGCDLDAAFGFVLDILLDGFKWLRKAGWPSV